jgi:hypothetical protein
MHTFGFGVSEGGHVPAQIQGLFSQIGKEYNVVRRFRRPVEDALGRLGKTALADISTSKGKGKAADKGTGNQAQTPTQPQSQSQSQQQRRSKDNQSATEQQHRHHPRQDEHRSVGLERTEPQHLHSRKPRVSFEIPSRDIAADVDNGPELGGDERRIVEDEAMEICRRMWDLGNAGVAEE